MNKAARSVLAALVLALAAWLAPRPALAQGTTADKIRQAIDLYNRLEIEAARPLLQEVLSPTWLLPITTEERVTAYKYLGASYAVIGKADTAATYFIGALAWDAFTDLDPNAFTAAELSAFNLAKTRIFKIGIKPLTNKVVDPKDTSAARNSYPFRITNTHRADLLVEVVFRGASGDSIRETIFRGTNDGLRDLTWRGTIGGQLAPPGNYQLLINATPEGAGTAITDRLEFTVQHSFEPLEELLPPLGATDTLVASYNPRDPLWDLVKGVSLGIATASLAKFAFDDKKVEEADKGRWNTHWIAASGVGVGAGLFAFSYRRTHLAKPAAVAENAERRRKWVEFNDGVRSRNAVRIENTKLIVRPR